MVPKEEASNPQALVTTGHKRSGDSTPRPLSTLAKKKPRMLLTKRQQQQEEKATSSVVSKSTSSKPGTGTPAAAILATLKKPVLARQRQLLASLKPIRDARRQMDTVVRYRSEDADAKLSALASTWRKAARGIAEALRDSVIARTGGGGDGDENGAATGMFHIRGGTGRSSQRANATATSFNPFDYDPEGTELAEAQEEERRRKEAEEEEDFYSRPTAVRFTMKLLLESMGVDIASLVGDEDGCSYDEEADCFE